MRECLDDDLDLPRLRKVLDSIQNGTIRVVRRQGEIPSPFTSELIFLFTAAQIYEWDEPKRSDRKPVGSAINEDLLQPLLRGGRLDDWLDPQAIGRVRIVFAAWGSRRGPRTRWPNTFASSAT